MPHLPTTWRERNEADLERKIERLQRDQRFQWLRTQKARRILVIISALLLVGVIPAFAQGGLIIGAVVTAMAAASWWLLRTSIRAIADLPERFLDERQQAIRNGAFRDAYLTYSFVISGLAVIGLVVFAFVTENDTVTLTTTWSQAWGGVFFVSLLASMLPSMVVAWRDAGEPSTESMSIT